MSVRKALRELTGLTTRLGSLNAAVEWFQSASKMAVIAATSTELPSMMSYSRLLMLLLPLLPPRAERVKFEVMIYTVVPSIIIPFSWVKEKAGLLGCALTPAAFS